MTLKAESKMTIAMVASVLAVFLLLLQLFGVSLTGAESVQATAVGGPSKTPLCLWQIGEGDSAKYNLVSNPSFCNRLFSQYANGGECKAEQNIISASVANQGNIEFAYEGFCKKAGNQQFAIYTGHVI